MPTPETCSSHTLPSPTSLRSPCQSKKSAGDAVLLGTGEALALYSSPASLVGGRLCKWGSKENKRNHLPPGTAVKSCSPAESDGAAIAPLQSINAYNCWRGGGRIWGGGCEEGRGEGLRWDGASVGVCLLLYAHFFFFFLTLDCISIGCFKEKLIHVFNSLCSL